MKPRAIERVAGVLCDRLCVHREAVEPLDHSSLQKALGVMLIHPHADIVNQHGQVAGLGTEPDAP